MIEAPSDEGMSLFYLIWERMCNR